MSTQPVRKIGGDDYAVMNLQGKAYAPVHQRIEAATKAGGYTMLSCEYKVIFEKQVCEVWIEVEGKKFCGTAEIKKDFSRPLEDGQTSAVGRALGFAGFNIETAIATAEDMASLDSTTVEAEPPRQLPQRTQPVKVIEKQLPAPKVKIPSIAEQCLMLANDLHMTEEARADLKQQYTVNGKIDWQGIKDTLLREETQVQK